VLEERLFRNCFSSRIDFWRGWQKLDGRQEQAAGMDWADVVSALIILRDQSTQFRKVQHQI
jgi:hypothetical protein